MSEGDQEEEVARLRARVAELEEELQETQRRTNLIVAEAQEQLRWLERWHIDINALMEKPGADAVREWLRRLRKVVRVLRNAKRKVLG
jgi:hypothetical protein